MRIALLGWGSLIWDPRELPREGEWQRGGPRLPIEFSRVSSDCRLTLVVDHVDGRPVPTRFSLSPRSALRDAVVDLGAREGTRESGIGFVCITDGSASVATYDRQQDVCETVTAWCRANELDAAVWTALPPTFQDETGKAFSVDNAVSYLRCLPKTARTRAYTYIRNAPPEVVTPVRERLVSEGLL